MTMLLLLRTAAVGPPRLLIRTYHYRTAESIYQLQKSASRTYFG